MNATTYYAIGDVHGMDDMLGALHEAIFADMQERGGDSRLVHLGDYVDRGPKSRQVIERLMRLQTDRPDAVCLTGNHEDMMVKAYADGARWDAMQHWRMNGGVETLDSYNWGGDYAAVSRAHLEWMARLPYEFRVSDERLLFVHAGIEPDDFPSVDREVALWTRSRRFFGVQGWADNKAMEGWMVVHGHTPTLAGAEYNSDGQRINLDTGACFGRAGSCLTGARIEPGQRVTFVSVDREGTIAWVPHHSTPSTSDQTSTGVEK